MIPDVSSKRWRRAIAGGVVLLVACLLALAATWANSFVQDRQETDARLEQLGRENRELNSQMLTVADDIKATLTLLRDCVEAERAAKCYTDGQARTAEVVRQLACVNFLLHDVRRPECADVADKLRQ